MCFHWISYCRIAWRLFDLESEEVIILRDVVFYEDKSPFLENRESLVSCDGRVVPQLVEIGENGLYDPQKLNGGKITTRHN